MEEVVKIDNGIQGGAGALSRAPSGSTVSCWLGCFRRPAAREGDDHSVYTRLTRHSTRARRGDRNAACGTGDFMLQPYLYRCKKLRVLANALNDKRWPSGGGPVRGVLGARGVVHKKNNVCKCHIPQIQTFNSLSCSLSLYARSVSYLREPLGRRRTTSSTRREPRPTATSATVWRSLESHRTCAYPASTASRGEARTMNAHHGTLHRLACWPSAMSQIHQGVCISLDASSISARTRLLPTLCWHRQKRDSRRRSAPAAGRRPPRSCSYSRGRSSPLRSHRPLPWPSRPCPGS